MEDPTKKGYLHAYASGVGNELNWVKRYYVLYNQSERTQARLDWYENEGAFVSSPTVRKTIYVEHIMEIKRSASGKGNFEHMFEILIKGQTNVQKFAAYDHIDLEKWISQLKYCKEVAKSPATVEKVSHGAGSKADDNDDIYEAPAKAQTFSVEINETDASKRCKLVGHYSLVVSNHHISVQDDKRNPLFSWPYKLIRRYGGSGTSFTMEAGRKCDSGPGTFTFNTDSGKEIFAAMQHMTKVMKEEGKGHQQHPQKPQKPLKPQMVAGKPPPPPSHTKGLRRESSDSMPPGLPERKYGQYVALAAKEGEAKGDVDTPDGMAPSPPLPNGAQGQGPGFHHNPLPHSPKKGLFGGIKVKRGKQEKQHQTEKVHDKKSKKGKGSGVIPATSQDKDKKGKDKSQPGAKDNIPKGLDENAAVYANMPTGNADLGHVPPPKDEPYYDVYDDSDANRYSSIDEEPQIDSVGGYSEVFNSVESDFDSATYAEPEPSFSSMSELAEAVRKKELHSQDEDEQYDCIDLRRTPQRPNSGGKSKSVPAAGVPEGHLYGRLSQGKEPMVEMADGERVYDEIDMQRLQRK